MKRKTFVALGAIAASFSLLPVAACGAATFQVPSGQNHITIFSQNSLQSKSNQGRSFDSSYAVATLDNMLGPTHAHFMAYSTSGDYGGQYNPLTGYSETPQSQQYNELLSNEPNSLETTPTPDGKYFVTTVKIKAGFGYVDKNGNRVQGMMPSWTQATNNTTWSEGPLSVTKWDILLNFARFQLAYQRNFAQNSYFVTMLGLDINQTIWANLQNQDPLTFILITSHSSPVSSIINKEFFSSPISPGYVRTLMPANTDFATKDISDFAEDTFGTNFVGYNQPGAIPNSYTMVGSGADSPGISASFYNYVDRTTQVYGADVDNYNTQSKIIFNGKYYVSSYYRDTIAVFKKNPFFNMDVTTPGATGRPQYTEGGLQDAFIFDTIREILSNTNAASDPTEKAYAQFRDGQIDNVPDTLVNANNVQQILNEYPQYVKFIGSRPTAQTNNISFSMNIWNDDGTKKSNVSEGYEKLVKAFYTPQAIDLRYNLMRAVNYVSVAKSINPLVPGSINLSSSPIRWANYGTDATQPDPAEDLPLYQDQHRDPTTGAANPELKDPALSMMGGNTTADLEGWSVNDGFTNQNGLDAKYGAGEWARMQAAVQSDLDAIVGANQSLPLNYMTLVQYSNVQLNSFTFYDQAWNALSNGRIRLSVTPMTQETQSQIYNDQNAEIASNFWAPDFNGGIGTWLKAFTGRSFNAPDLIYGLAKTGMFTAAKGTRNYDGTSDSPTNNEFAPGIPKPKFGFDDLAQYIINNWAVLDAEGNPVPRPTDGAALQSYILGLDEDGAGQVDPVKWTNASGPITDQIADLMTFWINLGDGTPSDPSSATQNDRAGNSRGYRLSSWANSMSFLVPWPDQKGYAAQNPMLTAHGLQVNTPQVTDSVLDFADIYQRPHEAF